MYNKKIDYQLHHTNTKKILLLRPSTPLIKKQHIILVKLFLYFFLYWPTRQNPGKRLDKHQSCLNLEVCNHLQTNLNHIVDFNNLQLPISFLDKSKLLILESLYIQELKPSLNLDSKSFLLHLFNTPLSFFCCAFNFLVSAWHCCVLIL